MDGSGFRSFLGLVETFGSEKVYLISVIMCQLASVTSRFKRFPLELINIEVRALWHMKDEQKREARVRKGVIWRSTCEASLRTWMQINMV